MKFNLYQVDAFTNKLFGGNPAAVVPLKGWIDEGLMQQLAMENNLAETVFFVPVKDEFDIRWFTPVLEINLCGHATLASAFVLYNFLGYEKPKLTFNSKSGKLLIEKEGNNFKMDFPSWKPQKINEYPANLQSALGVEEIVAVYKYRDLLVELNTEEEVRNIQPDFTALKKMGEKVIITAPGKTVDFVSRFFAPVAGIDEDPVTGSAHSQLIPFWSEKLNKRVMQAKQLSQRGGDIYCEQNGERVIIGGECKFYMKGEFEI
ncbi:MAG: PhzF family phenazine biosynthesis protein [Bacteroidetes bacterium]|nr:PhzF family phenazine biosynthesis protein [Bacteroidota bacterium]